jgi:hypothetical protein
MPSSNTDKVTVLRKSIKFSLKNPSKCKILILANMGSYLGSIGSLGIGTACQITDYK